MADLSRHLHSKGLTQRQTIYAHCYHCSGYGEEDCEVRLCQTAIYRLRHLEQFGSTTLLRGKKYLLGG